MPPPPTFIQISIFHANLKTPPIPVLLCPQGARGQDSGREDEAATAVASINVRFTGTAKGMSDEQVETQDMIQVNEESIRLKKASSGPVVVESRKLCWLVTLFFGLPFFSRLVC